MRLRWRLVLAIALILAAVLAAAGIFSSITVKREFDRFLLGQLHQSTREAAAMIRSAPSVEEGLRRVHEQLHFRTIVVDDRGAVVACYPPEMASYRVEVAGNGSIHLTRRKGTVTESLKLRGNTRRIPGLGTVYFIPPADVRRGVAPESFRISVDRWLVAALAGAALLAIVLMLTTFRRIFAPVEELTRGARALAGGRLDARVGIRGRDEIAGLAQAFNTMAESLERNDRARRNMVSDVAHELRTPLTNIRVQIEAAQDGVLPPDAKLLESVAEEVATLSALVDDLQQLSLADAGQLRLEIAEVNVGELVDRALEGLRVENLTREIPADLCVRADSRRMVQVLRNLLVNATAWAESAVDIRAARRDGYVEILVADDGPGVPSGHETKIFERFYRTDASRSRATGAAGLGLAIAKELVELHGGTIRYERPAFIVLLPFIIS
jgi:signal transduction histidine kinase